MPETGAGGRLDRPPATPDLIALPYAFGRRFALFVDTEEEFDWDDRATWHDARTVSTRAIPAANARLGDGGALPVYLVDYPIAVDPRAVDPLRPLAQAGRCEIGAQLHPWNTPPIEEEFTSRNSFVGNLAVGLEQRKIAALREAIGDAFGDEPIAFRAGRYGVGPNTADALIDNGFRLDVSVRPLFDYRSEGGPDYSAFGLTPFWAGDDRSLVALPLSATRIGALRASQGLVRLAERSATIRSLLARARLRARVALTPEGMPIDEACEAVRILLGEGCRLLSFSFHSPSLEPGHTPYVRDAAELLAFWRWWDAMFALLAAEGLSAVGCQEIVDAAGATRRRAASLATDGEGPLSTGGRAGPVAQR